MFSKYYVPHVGGVERHVDNLGKELQKKGCDITLITDRFNNKLKLYECVKGIKVKRISYPKIKYIGLLYIWKWICQNRNQINKSDVIHIHDVFIWYLPFRFLYPLKKVFITFHGYPTYPLSKKAVLYQKIAEILTHGNICVGDFMKKWFKTHPTRVSYGAVDLLKFKSVNKKSKYDAIFSSRLDEQTGILTYLDAIRILKNKKIDFKLIVLGDGKYRKKAERVAECKGFVKDPSPYFKQARFAFVNRYLAILEAFASKKLVFAVYDNPLKEDYLRKTPFGKWMIIEKDPKILADKIEYFLSHPEEYKKYTDPAYKWVQNQTWEKLTNQYLELWGVEL